MAGTAAGASAAEGGVPLLIAVAPQADGRPKCAGVNRASTLLPPPLPPLVQTGLNEGGKLLWIAPSGGRDRRIDPVTGAEGHVLSGACVWCGHKGLRVGGVMSGWVWTADRMLASSPLFTSARPHPTCTSPSAGDSMPDPLDPSAVELPRSCLPLHPPCSSLLPHPPSVLQTTSCLIPLTPRRWS